MQTETDIRRLARRRVGMKMGFYIHALVFILVNTGLYLINEMNGGLRWHHFPLWGWGLGLGIHGLVTLLSLSGARERMIEREIETLRRR